LNHLSQTIQLLVNKTENIAIDSLSPQELAIHIENRSIPYDIILSDIDMGVYNGIDFANKINHIAPACIIIFISNYLNYATDVYEVSHVYFVLKSEVDEKLTKALEKAFQVYNERITKNLLIRFQNTEYRIPFADITYLEALGRYLYIHDSKQSYKSIQSLKSIVAELSPSFSRCHNSYLVHMKFIHSINRTSCVLTTGESIPISQTYSKKFQSDYVTYVSRELL
jgi:DNA-binding LytR/AlgR family response regulator